MKERTANISRGKGPFGELVTCTSFLSLFFHTFSVCDYMHACMSLFHSLSLPLSHSHSSLEIHVIFTSPLALTSPPAQHARAGSSP